MTDTPAASYQAQPLVSGLAFPESARWHDGRLWFAHWGSGQVVAVGMDGASEVMATGPDGFGWSIDWLPDGRLLTTGPRLLRTEPDGSAVEHGHLQDVAAHGWNEIAVAANGDVYVNGFEFDLTGGGPPKPGIIALVRADGSTLEVADGIQFANGMRITPDGSTLVIAESFAGRLTAFSLRPDGTLADRQVWADGVAHDGICLDRDGAIWCGAADIAMMTGQPDSPAGAFIRVARGGTVLDRIELTQPGFSCALGGPDGRTLFMLTAQWRGFDAIDAMVADRTGVIFTAEVAVPASTSLQ
jgi:sugar lactone lactonase YvrE